MGDSWGDAKEPDGAGKSVPMRSGNAGYLAPATLFLLLAGSIFFIEVTFMNTMHGYFNLSPMREALLDASVLVLSILPIMYFLQHKPLVFHIKKLEDTQGKLASALDALEQSYMEQSAIMEANPDILYVFNMDGELIKWNSNLVKLCGLSPEEMMNRPALEFVCEEDRPVIINGMLKVFEEGAAHVEARFIRHDGALVPYWCNGVVLKNPAGDVIGFTGTGRDMTEHKKAEEALKAAKEGAEEATKLKDKFVSLVAHDLKTPLATMTGFLKLVTRDTAAPLNEGVRLILEKAIETGTQMSTLIDEVLSLSRLKTGALKLDLKFFDANITGAKIVTDNFHAARQKGIELKNEIPPNSRIYADKALLAEVIQNLVANAIKFCKENDSIVIQMKDASTLCVRDTGRGIDPKTLEKLFHNPGSKAGTAGEAGTGYGLMLVKEIVELHGGNLIVRSESGQGCLFNVKLPGIRPRVLVMDDDDVFRFTQRAQLQTLDVEILEAVNGNDALNMILKEPPHLVISDIGMPGGLELLEKIKGAHETQHIPVIMVSATHGMEIRDTVFKLGADDFVVKPWEPEDFIPRVRRFIG